MSRDESGHRNVQEGRGMYAVKGRGMDGTRFFCNKSESMAWAKCVLWFLPALQDAVFNLILRGDRLHSLVLLFYCCFTQGLQSSIHSVGDWACGSFIVHGSFIGWLMVHSSDDWWFNHRMIELAVRSFIGWYSFVENERKGEGYGTATFASIERINVSTKEGNKDNCLLLAKRNLYNKSALLKLGQRTGLVSRETQFLQFVMSVCTARHHHWGMINYPTASKSKASVCTRPVLGGLVV